MGRTVILKDDNIEKALRKFKKKILDFRLIEDLREREHYEKPTTARKRKKGAARSRWLKQVRAQELPKKLF